MTDKTTPMHMIEAQKERETYWVQDGAAAFMRRLETQDPLLTPAGKGILKMASDRFRVRLASFCDERSQDGSGMRAPTFAVIMLLGVDHCAAVTLQAAVSMATTGGAASDPKKLTTLTWGKTLGQSLEHDLRFRAWRKDAKGTEKIAVARMRERMKGSPKTWRTRAAQLRSLAEIEWDLVTLLRVGVDLLGLLAEATPDVFEARVVQHGHKSYHMIRLTDEVANRLLLDTKALSTNRPKFGLMLVPPRPWQYEEKPR